MMKALFARKKTTKPFKDFHNEWCRVLKNTLLPLLRQSLSSTTSTPSLLLPTHVESLLHHFHSYYNALDLAAADNVAQLLYPDWRNSLEKPFLWLGDFHPYLFTNLFRSLLEANEEEVEEEHESRRKVDVQLVQDCNFLDNSKSWQIATAWNDPSEALMTRIDRIECGLRFMVPALVSRARDAQADFIEKVGTEWGKCDGKKEEVKEGIEEAVASQMQEMVAVFLDANRLRRNVLSEIVAATTNVYQAALFLQGLAEFHVGFRDSHLLGEFESCKMLPGEKVSSGMA